MSIADILSEVNQRAIKKLRQELSADSRFEELTDHQAHSTNTIATWKTFVDALQNDWEVHIEISSNFPFEVPKTRIINGEELFFKIPHIDHDGTVCIVPNETIINSKDPVKIFFYLIKSVKEILRGAKESEFQEEFLSYWIRGKSITPQTFLLLSSPESIQSQFYFLKYQKMFLLAHSETEISTWVKHKEGIEHKLEIVQNGICINLNVIPSPNDYPNSMFDLLKMIKKMSIESLNLIAARLINSNQATLLIFRHKAKSGYILPGLLFFGQLLKNNGKFTKGFRKESIPSKLLITRATGTLKKQEIFKCLVDRVDHKWIHSRGGDGKCYKDISILVIGCGALGGYVGHLLSRAGIGKLTFIDKDTLEVNNIGRHILGINSVGCSKATALACYLNKQLPHLEINGICNNWENVFKADSSFPYKFDLIISTTANWNSEESLNLIFKKNMLPPVLYGWLEPYAVAGHAMLCFEGSGCLACHMDDWGRFGFSVSTFEDSTLMTEPGGCTQYQQYGTAALMPVATMIVTTALDSFDSDYSTSILHTWISSKDHFNKTSAKISPVWSDRVKEQGFSHIFETEWSSSSSCDLCNE